MIYYDELEIVDDAKITVLYQILESFNVMDDI